MAPSLYTNQSEKGNLIAKLSQSEQGLFVLLLEVDVPEKRVGFLAMSGSASYTSESSKSCEAILCSGYNFDQTFAKITFLCCIVACRTV